MELEHEFSKWLVAIGDKEPGAVLKDENLTLAAMNWVHAQSSTAIDVAMKRGIPVGLVLDSTFLMGVTMGYLFREYLAQMEIRQL